MLLGAAAFCSDFQGWSHNSTAKDKLNEIYGTLKQLGDQKPSPGNSKIDNIKAAKEQELEVRDWVSGTGDYFKPIAPIPNSPEVSSEAFAADLRRTLDQLQREADAASVQLPPKYSFAFEAQRSIVKFAGSLSPLAVQLGEVKTISEILFAAHVNSIDNIQRARVSDDDTAGPQEDYLNDASMTNDLAVLTPYAVTFRSFSGELASVLAAFATSPHGFVVEGVNISPAGMAPAPGGSPEGGGPPPMMMPPPGGMPGRGGLPTVLNEQLLRITLKVVIVKPLPLPKK